MKYDELIKVLEQRKKECQKHLNSFNKELDEMRKEKEIGFDREMIGGMQHQIGYMTAAIYEIENTIRLIGMSMEEYQEEKRLMKKYQLAQRKELKSILEELDNE